MIPPGKMQLAALFIALWLITPISYAQKGVTSVEGVSLTVSVMDSVIGFYTKILPFKIISDEGSTDNSNVPGVNSATKIRKAVLQLGEEKIELIDFISNAGNLYPEGSRSNDLWFQHIAVIVSNMDSAYNWLMQNNVRGISPAPQRLPDWNKNAGGIKAWYFQDPDGHPLEILEFPPGKGDPKWQNTNGKLFLGIDHTAIAVSNTHESLKFYRDVLGLKVAGNSDNYGIEQEKLNNVPGAHLKITALRAETGMGVEFLEYTEPNNGRLYPKNTNPGDLIRWEIILSTTHPEELIKKLQMAGIPYEAETARTGSVSSEDILIIDPDGHRIRIRELI